MVLIAATVCTKSGKALVSRQFVEMTKARIEGLLAAFPKLMTGGRQHTFVETESVRYVYQPLDKLYMLLITTKASNILEDLETLRLFSRVLPEYCSQMTETEVLNQAFNILFAFDEIVALGYRENVNLAQVRSCVEMDSHEEKIYQAVRQTQEREAANRMRERAKELQRERLEAAKRGQPRSSQASFGGGFGSSTMSSASSAEPMTEKIPTTPVRETRPSGRSAMKLGGKGADAESFVSRLRSEGDALPAAAPAQKATRTPTVPHNDVHLRFEERLNLVAGRDGDIQNFELSGLLTLHITNEQYGRIRVHVDNKDTRPLQLQVVVAGCVVGDCGPRLKYTWGDALQGTDCPGPDGAPYPRHLVNRALKSGLGASRQGRAARTLDPQLMRRALLDAHAGYSEGSIKPQSGNRTARASTVGVADAGTCGGGRLCRTRYNTTAPMYGVSLTSGQPVTIVQKFPDLLQQVVFEVCESSECSVIRGSCTQTYVPYLFLVLPLGPVTLTGQDYVLVESGCVCRQDMSP